MPRTWNEKVTGPLEEKREYRDARRRLAALPAPYRAAAAATQRYLMSYGGTVNGGSIVAMTRDLADLWEAAAADRTPVTDVVGSDPVDFVEEFVRAYAGRQWLDRERSRLRAAIATAATTDASSLTDDSGTDPEPGSPR